MELIKPKTTAQKFDKKGVFWGKDVQDINIGDYFKHGGSKFMVEEVLCFVGNKAQILTSVAIKFIHGEKQTAPQWFNQDAEIEWL